MNQKDWVLYGILLVIGIVAVIGLTSPKAKTIVDRTQVDVNAIAQSVLEVVQRNLPIGAAGQDFPGPCISIAGKLHCSYTAGMTSASSTCAFKTPSATTTLDSFVAHFKTMTGAHTVELGLGSQPSGVNGTTTQIAFLDATANGRQQTVAATSGAAISPNELTDLLVAPNQWLVVRVGSSSPTHTGTCSAELLGI